MKESIQAEYEKSKFGKEIKENLLHFLEYYSRDMPEYAVPSVVNSLLFEKGNSFS